MSTTLATLLQGYTENEYVPMDNAIHSAKLNGRFRDVYTRFEETHKDLINTYTAQAASDDAAEKDRLKALTFYTCCPEALDVINEVISGTPEQISELLIFFKRLIEALRRRPNQSCKIAYCKLPGSALGDTNTAVGSTFVWPGFVNTFSDLSKCIENTNGTEGTTVIKITESFNRKDVSDFCSDITGGVILPGSSSKVTKIETLPEHPGVTVVVTTCTTNTEIGKTFSMLKKAGNIMTAMGENVMKVSNDKFIVSNTKPSPLEEYFKTIPRDYYVTLLAALKEANFTGLGESVPDFEEKKVAAAKDLMDRCKETIKYLNEKGVIEKYGLTEEDAMAITIFTFDYGVDNQEKNPQHIINKRLGTRNTKEVLDTRGYILHLLSALRKLPRYNENKILYRAINANIAGYKVGDTKTWPAFTSTCIDEDSTMDFLTGDSQVIFEIHGDFCGYNIEDFSIFHEEGT